MKAWRAEDARRQHYIAYRVSLAMLKRKMQAFLFDAGLLGK